MPQTNLKNRRIVLAERPTGAPTPASFRLEDAPIPTPAGGELLLRTLWLSFPCSTRRPGSRCVV